MEDKLLTTPEAARLLGKSDAWMTRARWQGTGPPYRKIGRSVRYLEREVLEYRESRTHTSTSEYAA